MNNEKLDNLLNLALDATEEEREKSEELNAGYDAEGKTWQLIVKASGGLEGAEPFSDGIVIRPLLNGYAVLTVPQDRVEEVSGWPEIEYIEKPKRLFFAVNEGRRVSCVNSLQVDGIQMCSRESLKRELKTPQRRLRAADMAGWVVILRKIQKKSWKKLRGKQVKS